jgi:serine/threonine-protein kinase
VSPTSPPEEEDRVGQVLLGKLQVIRKLGGGGMGEVYEVEHLLTHHRRAIKIVRPEYARQRRFVERLLREASIAGRLKTPYVVETLDAGRLDDESAYVLMELLEGRSLHELLKAEPQLSQRRVASIVCQVAEGIGVAHAAGIVHRDLKPENIFITEEGEGRERVKILDFGVSKLLEGITDDANRLTREGTVLGTPFYMAPEQASGRTVDGRTDVWAMGVIMYEALSGKLPFNGETVGEVLIQIGAGIYPPLKHRRPDLEAAFVAVVDRALRSDPRDRYVSAEALRRDLLPFASGERAARAKTISDGHRVVSPDDGAPRATPRSEPPRPAGSIPEEITAQAPAEDDAEGASARKSDPQPVPARRGALAAAWAVGAIGAMAIAAIAIGVASTSSSDPPHTPAAAAPPIDPQPVTDVEPPPSPIVAAVPDAGPATLQVQATPPVEATDPGEATTEARTRVRPRTRAEQVGLETSPYGRGP